MQVGNATSQCKHNHAWAPSRMNIPWSTDERLVVCRAKVDVCAAQNCKQCVFVCLVVCLPVCLPACLPVPSPVYLLVCLSLFVCSEAHALCLYSIWQSNLPFVGKALLISLINSFSCHCQGNGEVTKLFLMLCVLHASG